MLDILALVFFGGIFIFIIYFLLFRAKEPKPEEEIEDQPVRERGARRPRGRLHQRLNAEENEEENQGADGENQENGEEELDTEGLSKKEMQKLIKKREKEKRKRELEEEKKEREAKLEQKRQYQSDKYKKREEERLAREAEEKKEEEERKKKEEEEYAKLKLEFNIDKEGIEAEEDKADSQNKLAEFIDYIKGHKVVALNDLAAEFSMPTASVISRIKDLEKDNRLSGILDDRGKYIYISQEEFKKVAELLRSAGRISKIDLVRECNKLIKLIPAESDKKKYENQVLEMEKEMEKQMTENEIKGESSVKTAA